MTARPKNPEYGFYQIKRVFLGCPGDLMSERSRFPRVLETVNNLRAHSLGFHLEPIGWERIIPSFGRPQQLINEELPVADLAIIMFWNRIGSPSSTASSKTGTLEEFEIASRLHEQYSKPSVWVYFRKPTSDPDAQLEGVLAFRKQLEEGKQLFFREYQTPDQWEEMLREHLVAYLDGMKRADLDENFAYARPERTLLHGRFLGDGTYRFGTRMRFKVDLDGDGNNENVTFWFSQFSYKMTVTRFDSSLYLSLPIDAESLDRGHIAQVVIKDVTNDGLPEILVAFGSGFSSLKILVFGFNGSGRTSRQITKETFVLLDQFEGQSNGFVHEGGTLILPYGSQGLAFEIKWIGDSFERKG
jgi:hypothetical protein